jgi:aminopeptidase 2
LHELIPFVLSVFDAISYSKGAAVLRMLSKMVGEEDFLKGVSLYLKQNGPSLPVSLVSNPPSVSTLQLQPSTVIFVAYSNASTEDLWKAISTVSGIDVTSIAQSWVQKVRLLSFLSSYTRRGPWLLC